MYPSAVCVIASDAPLKKPSCTSQSAMGILRDALLLGRHADGSEPYRQPGNDLQGDGRSRPATRSRLLPCKHLRYKLFPDPVVGNYLDTQQTRRSRTPDQSESLSKRVDITLQRS